MPGLIPGWAVRLGQARLPGTPRCRFHPRDRHPEATFRLEKPRVEARKKIWDDPREALDATPGDGGGSSAAGKHRE